MVVSSSAASSFSRMNSPVGSSGDDAGPLFELFEQLPAASELFAQAVDDFVLDGNGERVTAAGFDG